MSDQPVPPVDLDDRVGATEVVPTGHDGVDEVLDQLRELDGAAVADHVVVFERVHAGLRQVLDDSAAG